jgi:tetratricopeptide (TPR) repeat protein
MEIIQELTKKVINHFKNYIINHPSEDKTIQKISQNCLEILDHTVLKDDILISSIKFIKIRLIEENTDPYLLLLLALLLQNHDDDELSLNVLNDWNNVVNNDNPVIKNELSDFIILTRFFTCGIGTIEQVGLKIIELSTPIDIMNNMMQLAQHTGVSSDVYDSYAPIIVVLEKRYSDNFEIMTFCGWLTADISQQLSYYQKAFKLLESQTNYPDYNFYMSNICSSIASSYFKLNKYENIINTCNMGLEFDKKNDQYQNEFDFLKMRGISYLKLHSDLGFKDLEKAIEMLHDEDEEIQNAINEAKNAK